MTGNDWLFVSFWFGFIGAIVAAGAYYHRQEKLLRDRTNKAAWELVDWILRTEQCPTCEGIGRILRETETSRVLPLDSFLRDRGSLFSDEAQTDK